MKLATRTGAVPNRAAEHEVATGLAQGFIGIDIYDGSTGGEVWQGSAFAEIDPDKVDDSLLKMGVSHILAIPLAGRENSYLSNEGQILGHMAQRLATPADVNR